MVSSPPPEHLLRQPAAGRIDGCGSPPADATEANDRATLVPAVPWPVRLLFFGYALEAPASIVQ